MSFGMSSEEMEREIERAIVRSFGWGVIEFEAVLFQKFLIVSGPTSLMTEDMFRRHLRNMQAKGYLAPVQLHGRRAWKRLVIESDIADEPDMSPDEVRAFLEQMRATNLSDKKKRRIHREGMVSESRALATKIIQTLESVKKRKKRTKIRETTLLDHIEAMHHSLASSPDEFLKYVKKNLPYPIYHEMKRLLDDRGEEMLLLSLRLIESGHRMYPP
ncbi:MAG: hypothetical protein DRO87_08635 [Candidatus Thorarchaeota archaeon]|nr:MAG: hypothetical protein DRO87_08635 [Candidatus Thorarchaeota archaeon]RLI57273.1 MAG: hypothetical protein DRP09_03250 [Candidatus Thorarchaeota archaeon]